MSDDTTKVLPLHDDAGDEKTTVLPVSDPIEPADTTVLPTQAAAQSAAAAASADTEVMEPTVAVRSQAVEDEQSTQALSQIPSTIDDFADTADDVDAADTVKSADETTESESSADETPADETDSDRTEQAIPGPAPAVGAVGPIPLDVPLSDAIPLAASVPTPTSMPEPTPIPTSTTQREASAPSTPIPPLATAVPAAAPTATPTLAPEPPKGASKPTVVFGLIVLLIGAIGLFAGLNPTLIGAWLYDLTPQTATAILFASVGAILLVIALIWSIAKAVSNRKTTDHKATSGKPDGRKPASDADHESTR